MHIADLSKIRVGGFCLYLAFYPCCDDDGCCYDDGYRHYYDYCDDDSYYYYDYYDYDDYDYYYDYYYYDDYNYSDEDGY